jgi:hypothetical protein
VAYSVQMQRMYDLANWTLNGDALSEEDKKKYEWDFDNGNWAGYKPPIGWILTVSQRGKAQPDFMEFYNWYGECWDKDMIPPKLRPFEDEIRAYASVCPLSPSSFPPASPFGSRV